MPKVDTLFFKEGSFYLPSALFCSTEHDSNGLNLFLTSRGNRGFRAESRCQFNCLFKEREKNKPFSLYCWNFTSASGPLAVRCWVLLRDCPSLQRNGPMLRWFVLFPNFFSGISSCQLPSPTHPLYCTALYNPPSVWRRCQTLWHMKTIVLLCLRRHNLLLRQAFLPPLTEAQLTVRQTDFLLLPRLPRPVLKEVVMFIKNGRRYLSPRPQSDSEPLISLTYRWSKGAFSPANECLKHCEADWESKSRKNITMCRFVSNKSSLAQLQNTGGKHPSGNQDRSPRWSWKNALHPSCFWITYFTFLLVRHKRLSCQSSDLCWLCNGVFHQGSFRAERP